MASASPRRCSHCAAKFFRQRLRTRVGQEALDLSLEDGGVAEFPLTGHRDQFFVRKAAPEEVGQPGGEFQIAYPVVVTRTDTSRGSLETEGKFGVRQDILHGHPDARLEVPVFAAIPVDLHEIVETLFAHRSPISLTSQPGDDLFGTGLFLTVVAGLQVNILRRLTVSLTPVAL